MNKGWRQSIRRSMIVSSVSILAVAGCAGEGGLDDSSPPTSSPGTSAPSTTDVLVEFNPTLHDELIAMMERDQAGRKGGTDTEGDPARTERLKEIIDEFGWPTFDLVGEDGEDAAWVIAQHSDLDPEFQSGAVEILRDAVAAGQASPGNLAYLEDRVLAGKGEPQIYGTQIGCGPDGPEPATPITDEDTVDARRAEAGLEPLADYMGELAEICQGDM